MTNVYSEGLLKIEFNKQKKYITHSDHASTTDELQAPVVVLARTISGVV